jgi:hypothetical protein
LETQSETNEEMRAISIMYHDVVERGEYEASGFPGADAALYKLEREHFEHHLEAIAEAVPDGVATVFDLLGGAQTRTPLLITFDDGGRSAATSIAGMLEARGWRGHFFITADYINAPTFVTREQILDLHRRGHVIGTHSCSHPTRMSHCSPAEMLREWSRSVEILSEILGEKVKVASVPGGHYSRRVAETAAAAGIAALFTSEPVTKIRHVDGCMLLGRFTIQRWMSAETAAALASGQLTPRLRQAALWNTKKMVKTIGGAYYLKVRKSLLGER